MKSLRLSILSCLLFVTVNASFAGSETHSGQGRKDKKSGRIVLSDFGGPKVKLVADNKAWAETIPDLMPLLKEIAEASPDIGIELYEQLFAVKIFTTPDPLVLAPVQDNSYIEEDQSEMPDTQIGYRDGDDILFQDEALKDHPEDKGKPDYYPPSYNVIHELLHGLIPGGRQIHQLKVGAFNDFLKQNRGHFTEDLILDAARTADVTKSWRFSGEFDRVAFKILIDETGDFKARCYLLMSDWYDIPGSSNKFPLEGVENSRSVLQRLGYGSCAKVMEGKSPLDYYLGRHSELQALEAQWHSEATSWIYGMNLDFKVSHDIRDIVKDQCLQYASDKLKADIDNTIDIAQKLVDAFKKIESEDESTDPAQALLDRLIKADHASHVSSDEYVGRLKAAQGTLSTWKTNREQCERAFPKLFAGAEKGQKKYESSFSKKH